MVFPAIVPVTASQATRPANDVRQANFEMPRPVDRSTAVVEENAAAQPVPVTIFDLLSEIVLRNIIRHVSHYPRRIDWASSMSPNDALVLYKVGGKLSDVAKKMFSQISVWREHSENKLFEYYNYDPQELCLNQQSTDSNVFAEIMEQADQYPTLLAFEELPITPLTCRIWPELSSRIEPICSLHILGAPEPILFDSVLAAVGPRLKSLGVRCDKLDLINSVARHCVGLDELTLYERHVNLSPLWDTVGPLLRVLIFEQDVRDCGELKAIQTRCRKLTKLDLYAQWDKRDLNPYITDLYASYGEQLLHANLFTMEPLDCRRVVDACPFVQCSASFTEFPEEGLLVKEGLQSVGPALSVATISFGDDTVIIGGLMEAANECRNLRELKMDQLRLNACKIVAALFSLPKSQLKILSISDVQRDSRALLDIIANNTGALTKFSYSGCITHQETVLGIRGLVSGNPNLMQLELNFEGQETAEPANVYASTSEDEFAVATPYNRYEETSNPHYDEPDAPYLDMGGSFLQEDTLYRPPPREINANRDLAAVERRNVDRDLTAFNRAPRRIPPELVEVSNIDRELALAEQRRTDEAGEGQLEEEDQYPERSETPSETDLVEFVKAVYLATELRELSIQIPHHLIPEPPIVNEAIAMACLRLRPRRVHVCVGSVDYLL